MEKNSPRITKFSWFLGLLHRGQIWIFNRFDIPIEIAITDQPIDSRNLTMIKTYGLLRLTKAAIFYLPSFTNINKEIFHKHYLTSNQRQVYVTVLLMNQDQTFSILFENEVIHSAHSMYVEPNHLINI